MADNSRIMGKSYRGRIGHLLAREAVGCCLRRSNCSGFRYVHGRLAVLLASNHVVILVSMAGSLVATSLVMSRQAMWLEAIERRIAATSEMLGAMKGVKMCGLTEVLSKSLQDLRLDELRISKKFRKLLIWNMGFSIDFHIIYIMSC